MSQVRVLLVGAFPPPGIRIFGGQVTSCRALIDSTFSSKFELILVDTTQRSNPPPNLLVRSFFAFRRIIKFFWALKHYRAECVILFTAVGFSLVEKGALSWGAKVFGVPALMFPRGAEIIEQCEEHLITRLWIRIAFSGANKVLCQGPAWQRFCIDTLGLPKSAAPIIPNWTASERLLMLGRNRTYTTNANGVRLLFLGWLEREKGIFELLEACNRLSDRFKFSLSIGGRGHAEPEARRYANDSGLDRCVRFLGWVEGDSLTNLLAESDILVLPSWGEGLPNAMIEAMAAGLAVVVSAVGNIPDLVSDGVNAILIKPRDALALEGALARLINDFELRHMLARNGCKLAADRFAIEPAVDALEKVIHSSVWQS